MDLLIERYYILLFATGTIVDNSTQKEIIMTNISL